jgi:hypothetical protein
MIVVYTPLNFYLNEAIEQLQDDPFGEAPIHRSVEAAAP